MERKKGELRVLRFERVLVRDAGRDEGGGIWIWIRIRVGDRVVRRYRPRHRCSCEGVVEPFEEVKVGMFASAVGFFRPCRRVPVRQEFAGGATTER